MPCQLNEEFIPDEKEQAIFCNAKCIKVVEVTIKREIKGEPIKLFKVVQKDCGKDITIAATHHTVKQYFDETGELLAERDVTYDNLDNVINNEAR